MVFVLRGCTQKGQQGKARSPVSPPLLVCRSVGAAPQTGPTVSTGRAITCVIWVSAQRCTQWPGGVWTPTVSSLSEIGTGFPRALPTACPSEVVRDQTRDKLGKDKEEIPQPLYLFVSFKCYFCLCGGV